jgi:pyridoxine 5'-phosphate synthase PdxJ
MRDLVLAIDSLYALPHADIVAAVKLAELAGVEAVRVSAGRPEMDVVTLRRTARFLEVAIEPTPAGLKVALEVRPDRVLLLEPAPHAVLRPLEEAGIPVHARIAHDVDAVKTAHSAGVAGVELDTSHSVDLPRLERAAALDRLGDAARMASKLRLPVSIGGSLDERTLRPFAERVPALARVAVGRALVARAALVGIERAVADFRARLL